MTPKTPAELRSLLAEGTGGEWRYQGEETHCFGERPRMDYRLYTVRGKFGNPATCGEEQDARSIVALHNLGEKFAALWEAAEGYRSRLDAMEANHPGCNDVGANACAEWEAIESALADLGGGA